MKYSEMSDTELIFKALDKAGYVLTTGETAVGSGSYEEDLKQCYLDYADCLGGYENYSVDEIEQMINDGEITLRELAMALIKYCR
jgi:hypothetical protein